MSDSLSPAKDMQPELQRQVLSAVASPSLEEMQSAVAEALSLPVQRLRLLPLKGAPYRRPAYAGVKQVIQIDGVPRYCVKWHYQASLACPIAEFGGRGALFTRLTGLRTPLFVALARCAEQIGFIEEYVDDAPTLASLLSKRVMELAQVSVILQQIFDRMLQAQPLADSAEASDRAACKRALRWVGEGSSDYASLCHLVENDATLFEPKTRLIHQDLLPTNLLVPNSGAKQVVIDFEHCVPSTMPWYAAWRLGWFYGVQLPEAGSDSTGLCKDRNRLAQLRLLSTALEVERQFTVLEPGRFLQDWNLAWKQALLLGREGTPGALSESKRIETILISPS